MPNFVIVKNTLDKKRINVISVNKRISVIKMSNEFQNKFAEIVDKNARYKTLSKRDKVLLEQSQDANL